MKCGAWIRFREKRKKGSGETIRVIDRRMNKVLPLWSVKMFNQKPPEGEGYFQCDGEIVATVDVVEEPSWGDHYGALEIEYKCKRCGNTVFHELPSDGHGLSRWLTEQFAALPESVRDQRFEKIRADNEKRNRQRIELELKLAEKEKKGKR